MMLRKRVNILKWLLLMTFTKGSGYTVVRFDNLKGGQLIGNVLNILQDNNAENDLRFRKSTLPKDYLNRKLVKRIIPHGFEIKNFEYDNKFKSLYKPLIRIHKRKPNADASVYNESRYDLMFVLDDKYYEDAVKLSKDESLLEPFAIDSTDIKYLPRNRDYENYIVNNNGNYFKNNLESNKYKLIDNTGLSKENTPNGKDYGAYVNSNTDKEYSLLKELLGKRKDYTENDDHEQLNTYKYKQIEQITELGSIPKKGNSTPKLKVLPWFSTVGRLRTKKFQVNEDDHIKLYAPEYIRSYEETPTYNAYKYLDSLKELIRERNEVKTRLTKKEITDKKRPIQWFGTVGQLHSKQLLKKNKNTANHIDFKDGYFNSIRDTYNFPNSVKRLNERQMAEERSDNDETGVFRSIRHLNRHDKQNERVHEEFAKPFNSYNLFYPEDNDKQKGRAIKGVETLKSDKFKLLDQIAQLKANLGNKEKDKRYELIVNDHLRSKSGEQDEILSKITWEETSTTTEKPEAWMPSYPFWNYWTYEKQIYQDKCKGKLVQYGQLCVNPFA